MTDVVKIRCAICARVVDVDVDKYSHIATIDTPNNGMRELNAHIVCWEMFLRFLDQRVTRAENGQTDLNGFKWH